MKNYSVKQVEVSQNSNEKTLYVGFAKVKPIIVNPTQEQMEKVLGYNNPKEPEYVGTDKNGNENLKLDFYLRLDGKKDIVKMSIWVAKVVPTSGSGKTMFINNHSNRTMYSESEETLNAWLDTLDKNDNPNRNWWGKSFRKSFDGEIKLYDFLHKFINPELTEDDEFRLENSIFTPKGIKELNEVLTNKAYENNLLQVALAVKDNQYQEVVTTREFVALYGNSVPAKNKKYLEAIKNTVEYKGLAFSYEEVRPYVKDEVKVETTNPFAVEVPVEIPTTEVPVVTKTDDLPF